ncbi:hypothetical protein BRC19_00375 [Candidatus Saccharibacteria bacterium QS_5_54_17]|nr:MAG: hypothetical protein BRC19_00375 [Candidatus Saccharibacteria bacterium QS_5_54_17]
MVHTPKLKPKHHIFIGQLRVSWALVFLVLAAPTLLLTLVPAEDTPTNAAPQTVPHLINYQGRLTDNQGQALPDGNYNMRFRIYDAETSGTQLWSTTRCYSPDDGTTCDGTGTDQRVSVQNGTFSLKLGKVNALPGDIFTNPTRYLEVELPTPSTNTNTSNPDWSEGPFTPRQQLNASPYAFNAEEIDGYDSDNIAILDENNTFTGNQNIFSGNTDSTTSLQVQTAAGSTIFNADTSNQRIGINTTSPATALDVSGQGNFTGVVSGADATANNEFVTLGQLWPPWAPTTATV